MRERIGTAPWAGLEPSLPLLRVNEIVRETGLSKTTLYEMIDAGLFPPLVRIGPRAVACPRAWLDAFLKDCAAKSLESVSRRRKVD